VAAAHHAKNSRIAPAVRTALGARSGVDRMTVRRVAVQITTGDAQIVRDPCATQVGPNGADQQIARVAPSVGIPPIGRAAMRER